MNKTTILDHFLDMVYGDPWLNPNFKSIVSLPKRSRKRLFVFLSEKSLSKNHFAQKKAAAFHRIPEHVLRKYIDILNIDSLLMFQEIPEDLIEKYIKPKIFKATEYRKQLLSAYQKLKDSFVMDNLDILDFHWLFHSHDFNSSLINKIRKKEIDNGDSHPGMDLLEEGETEIFNKGVFNEKKGRKETFSFKKIMGMSLIEYYQKCQKEREIE